MNSTDIDLTEIRLSVAKVKRIQDGLSDLRMADVLNDDLAKVIDDAEALCEQLVAASEDGGAMVAARVVYEP